MDKEQIMKEFDEAHRKNFNGFGVWKKNKIPEHMDLQHGYWYWKGHKIADLYEQIEEN